MHGKHSHASNEIVIRIIRDAVGSVSLEAPGLENDSESGVIESVISILARPSISKSEDVGVTSLK